MNTFWFFVNLLCIISILWLVAFRNKLPPPLRRPANVKSTCLKQEAAQLCFLPPLWDKIVLEKSISRAGQSLKLILLSFLERTLCATKNTFSCRDWRRQSKHEQSMWSDFRLCSHCVFCLFQESIQKGLAPCQPVQREKITRLLLSVIIYFS